MANSQTFFLSLLLLVLVMVQLAQANVCRDLATCCRTFDFQRPGSNTAAPYSQNTVAIQAGSAGPWHANGVDIRVAEVDSGTGQPYALGLFNATLPKTVLESLPIVGADSLHSLTQGLVLAAFKTYSTELLHNTQTLIVSFSKPACVASVTGLRSIDVSHRQDIEFQVFSNGNLTGGDASLWKMGLLEPDITIELNAPHADELHVKSWGLGYGALASFELCYLAPAGYDSCGVCGGDNTGCPVTGQPCSTGMGGICALGKYGDTLVCSNNGTGETCALQCVPNLSHMAETCNGLDDNCDGIIDNGDFGTWTCGTGQCQANISRCQGGHLVDSSACVPGTPVAEVCNGLDDDCDGVVDNGVCLSPSASPVPSSSPQPTPSASPAPQRPLLLPLLDCVRPAPGAVSSSAYEALFGYQLFGPGATSKDLPAGGSSNLLLVNGEPVPTDPDSGVTQPTHFEAGAVRNSVMIVPFSSGQTVQWHLDSQNAFADVGSVRCADVSQLSLDCVQPILQGCVTRLGGQCSVTVAYNNPNPQTVALDVKIGSNWVQPAPSDRRQPRVFYRGEVRDAGTITFDCSQPQWALNWTLAIGSQQLSALATQANMC